MMRVTVDIVPFGDESKARTIKTYEIGNIGGLDHSNPWLRRYVIYEGSRWADENRTEFRPADAYVWHDREDGAAVLVERVLARLRTGKEGACGLPGYPASGRLDGSTEGATRMADSEGS